MLFASFQYLQSSEVADHPWDKALQWMFSSDVHTEADASAPYGIGTIFEFDSPLVRLAEPYFAVLGKEVRHNVPA
jgi:hypothetical protein